MPRKLVLLLSALSLMVMPALAKVITVGTCAKKRESVDTHYSRKGKSVDTHYSRNVLFSG